MPLHWRPVGPEPASTYWTRRAVLALAVLLVLWGLLALLTGGAEDTLDSTATDVEATASPTRSATPSRSAGPSAEPSGTASPSAGAEVEPCADGDLELTATADKTVYALEESPTLVLTVRNASDGPCRRDLGQGASELVVTSGQDRIWSSDDCSPGGAPGTRVLGPGEEDVQRLTWSATRSRPGCEGEQAAVEPGTYVVSGRNGELRAEGDSFRFEG